MNTKSLLTRIGVPVLSLGLLGGLGATLATSASASTMATTLSAVSSSATVTANTHLNDHPDTTSGPVTGALQSSPNGAVWAYDNATEKFTLVPQGGGLWDVTMDYVGSFHGFADPGANGTQNPALGYGNPLTSDGSVKGTITYQVTSPDSPDPSLLPGQSPSDATISDNIQKLFAGTATISGGDVYTFSYQNGNYVQNGAPLNNITGDVTGH